MGIGFDSKAGCSIGHPLRPGLLPVLSEPEEWSGQAVEASTPGPWPRQLERQPEEANAVLANTAVSPRCEGSVPSFQAPRRALLASDQAGIRRTYPEQVSRLQSAAESLAAGLEAKMRPA